MKKYDWIAFIIIYGGLALVFGSLLHLVLLGNAICNNG